VDNHDKAVSIQRQYYADTAAKYDAMHAHEADDNPRTLLWIYGLLRMIEARTVLDVGAGTGRYIRRLLDDLPELSVRGIEPVGAQIEEAVRKKGIPEGVITQGTGEALPFEDSSFDVVCCFGMLHHVPKPDTVVREALRVARQAVIIVDGNRFGQGSWPLRLLKLALYKTGLWGVVNQIKTGGKGYLVTPGDGLAYSYSVYDSFDRLSEWADQLAVIPTGDYETTSWFHPLLTSSAVIVCAIKDGK
jgi:ubiquinone/menaquinone biosynthesis C-methylase UbiE